MTSQAIPSIPPLKNNSNKIFALIIQNSNQRKTERDSNFERENKFTNLWDEAQSLQLLTLPQLKPTNINRIN